MSSFKFTQNDWAMDSEIYPNVSLFQAMPILSDKRVMYGVLSASKNGVVYDKWFTLGKNGLEPTSSEYFLAFLNNKRFEGYNLKGFDNPVLNSVLFNIRRGKSVVWDAYLWGQRIVKYGSPYKMPSEFKKEAFALTYPSEEVKIPYTSIDLAQVITGNGGRYPSLKAVGVAMKWHKLQDLPLDPTKPVPMDKLQVLIDYGWNDVEITKALAIQLLGELELRQGIAEFFQTDLLTTLNSSRSKLTNVLFEKLYPSELAITDEYIDKKSREKLKVSDIVAPNVTFKSAHLQKFLNLIKTGVINPGERKALDYSVEYNGVVYQLGVGGLHSVDGPGLFTSDKHHTIIDADVTSYYPAIILNLELAPEHLDQQEFLTSFNEIIVQRVEAKKAGNMVKSDGLKITINGMTGKFNSGFWKVYDPRVYYSMTLNGQLYLLMLAEMLSEVGIQPISANTDGVTSIVPNDKLDTYREVCEQWEQATRFNLEYAQHVVYARRDVNNYITKSFDCWWDNGVMQVSPKHKVKQKGAFVENPGYDKSHNTMCVRKAVNNYILNDVPLRETIMSCDIYDFMYSQNVGKQFKVMWCQTGKEDVEVQRKNRYYIVKPEQGVEYGSLAKVRKDNGRVTALVAGKILALANDVTEDMPLPNYDYYENEAKNLLFDVIGQPRLI